MTEAEAMRTLVGRPAVVVEPTMTGTRTVVGRVTTPLLLTAEGLVELVTVEGMVVLERVAGLLLEPETPTRLEMLPLAAVTLM